MSKVLSCVNRLSFRATSEESRHPIKTIPGKDFCVIYGNEVKFATRSLEAAIAFQKGWEGGVVVGVLAREPKTIKDLFAEGAAE